MNAEEFLKSQELEKSHWGKRIIAAEQRDEFTVDDRKDAGKWLSCACGKLDDHIERGKDGTPDDSQLVDLGMGFYLDVCDDAFIRAAHDLARIEHRSRKLAFIARQKQEEEWNPS